MSEQKQAGVECAHPWVLDRPESDTWECLDCGAEGSGYPAAAPDRAASDGGKS